MHLNSRKPKLGWLPRSSLNPNLESIFLPAQQTHIPGGHMCLPCCSLSLESHVPSISPGGAFLDVSVTLWLLERDRVGAVVSVAIAVVVLGEAALGILPLAGPGTFLSFSGMQGKNPGGHSLSSYVEGSFLLVTGKLCPKFAAKRMMITTLITNMSVLCWTEKRKIGNWRVFSQKTEEKHSSACGFFFIVPVYPVFSSLHDIQSRSYCIFDRLETDLAYQLGYYLINGDLTYTFSRRQLIHHLGRYEFRLTASLYVIKSRIPMKHAFIFRENYQDDFR